MDTKLSNRVVLANRPGKGVRGPNYRGGDVMLAEELPVSMP
jgi:hypothetical protein